MEMEMEMEREMASALICHKAEDLAVTPCTSL